MGGKSKGGQDIPTIPMLNDVDRKMRQNHLTVVMVLQTSKCFSARGVRTIRRSFISVSFFNR